MPTTTAITPVLDRRQLLKGGLAAGAGLIIGLRLPRGAEARIAAAAGAEWVPNAFVRIGPDDTVTVLSKHIEFGQGTYTGLATILAEELDADWSTVKVVSAPADVTRYANLAFGAQGTGGSTAMANSWEQMRTAGATARAMLVAAAAATWEVPESEVEVSEGNITFSEPDEDLPSDDEEDSSETEVADSAEALAPAWASDYSTPIPVSVAA